MMIRDKEMQDEIAKLLAIKGRSYLEYWSSMKQMDRAMLIRIWEDVNACVALVIKIADGKTTLEQAWTDRWNNSVVKGIYPTGTARGM